MPRRTLDSLSKRETIRYLKQCCKDGQHAWNSSASPDYDICSRSWCNVWRRKGKAGRLYYGPKEQELGLPPMPGPPGQSDEVRKENATTETKQRTDNS